MKLDRKTVNVPIKNLHPFEGNPYKVQDGEEMDKLMESIQSQGILTPLVVRPMADAAKGYEVISGHRRLAACQKLEMKFIPVTIQQMDDNKAMIAVVDANLQREHILPSEKAFAFKMKLEALSHQGVTSAQVEQKLSRDAVAGDVGMSGAQVQRYIRLTYLIPELLKFVDQGKIAFTPAVHLSYLKSQEQRWVLEEMEKNACSPSVSQAYHLKEESQAGRLTQELTAEMMAREKAPENWAVFKDVHEPIIERSVFEQVQALTAKTKRRAPKPENGEKSVFSDLLYCGDCHRKLRYHTNTINKRIHFFVCSDNAIDYRGKCPTRHYVRADAIEQVVTLELRRMAAMLRADEGAFAEMLAQKTNKELEKEQKRNESELQKAIMRNDTVSRLYEKLYEDNATGKVSDEWFMQLSHKYEVERLELKEKITELRKRLVDSGKQQRGRESFMKAIRQFMRMERLTAPLLRELIDHIDVFETEGTGKNRTQRIVIYYRFVGYIEIPPALPRSNYKADTRKGVAVEYVTEPAAK